MLRRALFLSLLTMFASLGAMAQQNTNLRGTIIAFDGNQLSVKTREGGDVVVSVPETVNIAITRPFTMADVKPGVKLGVTTVQRTDGRIVAIDVRPISAAANIGLSPWDLQPQSTMTNAIMEGVAQSAEGNEITLNYNTGTVKALVLPSTAMSQAAPGSRADLKSGERVFVAAKTETDGKLTALRVQVGKDGVNPTQ